MNATAPLTVAIQRLNGLEQGIVSVQRQLPGLAALAEYVGPASAAADAHLINHSQQVLVRASESGDGLASAVDGLRELGGEPLHAHAGDVASRLRWHSLEGSQRLDRGIWSAPSTEQRATAQTMFPLDASQHDLADAGGRISSQAGDLHAALSRGVQDAQRLYDQLWDDTIPQLDAI